MDGFVNNAKGVVGILRDGLITIILILLLFVPKTVNNSLIEAGFTEGDFGGLKWKATVQQSTDQLDSANATIGALQTQLSQTEDALKESENGRKQLADQLAAANPAAAPEAAATGPSPHVTAEILQQNNKVAQVAQDRGVSLRAQIQVNQKLLETVRRQ